MNMPVPHVSCLRSADAVADRFAFYSSDGVAADNMTTGRRSKSPQAQPNPPKVPIRGPDTHTEQQRAYSDVVSAKQIRLSLQNPSTSEAVLTNKTAIYCNLTRKEY